MISEHSQLIAAGIDELAAQNPFREGRVTPDKLLDGPGFKLRHLAFDAGVVMKEHSAPVPLLIQVVAGRVLLRIEDAEHILLPGAVFYIAPKVLHEVEASDPSRLLLTLIG
ncbi:cupin [Microbacterium sp. CH12i]|uniref:cupin domain-containing protein n=1 Tax=Microbacterium sp. CH12i TaxID=1479651 RepID=UPI000460DD33|nr:cupin domain-containing protein [Microbacterium sp. CH12i]KDA06115.1 cupin [Microbacterium sp. CH12i]